MKRRQPIKVLPRVACDNVGCHVQLPRMLMRPVVGMRWPHTHATLCIGCASDFYDGDPVVVFDANGDLEALRYHSPRLVNAE